MQNERRIQCGRSPLSTRSMSALKPCQQHCVPRKRPVSIRWKPSWRLSRLSATTWSCCIQKPLLVQLLKVVQSRRFKRTLVRHGPRASHQSQGDRARESSEQWCLSCDVAVTGESLCKKSSSRSMEPDDVPGENDGRIAFVRVFGKASTGQVLPYGEESCHVCRSSCAERHTLTPNPGDPNDESQQSRWSQFAHCAISCE